MRERRLGRRLALDVLYEAEIRDDLPVDAFEARRHDGWVVPTEDDEGIVDEDVEVTAAAVDYAEILVRGVQSHQSDIDRLIADYADRWALQRMPVVDRTLLRIGIFEILWSEDVPVAVAINEAVELAKAISTDDSGRFINGLLGRVAQERAET